MPNQESKPNIEISAETAILSSNRGCPENEKHILVMGPTGSGKDALTLSGLGCILKRVPNPHPTHVFDKEVLEVERCPDSVTRRPVMGHHRHSETSLPEAYTLAGLDPLTLESCSGFFDNRGEEAQLLNLMGTQVMIHTLPNINGIVLVIPYEYFLESDLTSLGETIRVITRMFTQDIQPYLPSLHIAFSRLPEHNPPSKADCISALKTLLNEAIKTGTMDDRNYALWLSFLTSDAGMPHLFLFNPDDTTATVTWLETLKQFPAFPTSVLALAGEAEVKAAFTGRFDEARSQRHQVLTSILDTHKKIQEQAKQEADFDAWLKNNPAEPPKAAETKTAPTLTTIDYLQRLIYTATYALKESVKALEAFEAVHTILEDDIQALQKRTELVYVDTIAWQSAGLFSGTYTTPAYRGRFTTVEYELVVVKCGPESSMRVRGELKDSVIVLSEGTDDKDDPEKVYQGTYTIPTSKDGCEGAFRVIFKHPFNKFPQNKKQLQFWTEEMAENQEFISRERQRQARLETTISTLNALKIKLLLDQEQSQLEREQPILSTVPESKESATSLQDIEKRIAQDVSDLNRVRKILGVLSKSQEQSVVGTLEILRNRSGEMHHIYWDEATHIGSFKNPEPRPPVNYHNMVMSPAAQWMMQRENAVVVHDRSREFEIPSYNGQPFQTIYYINKSPPCSFRDESRTQLKLKTVDSSKGLFEATIKTHAYCMDRLEIQFWSPYRQSVAAQKKIKNYTDTYAENKINMTHQFSRLTELEISIADHELEKARILVAQDKAQRQQKADSTQDRKKNIAAKQAERSRLIDERLATQKIHDDAVALFTREQRFFHVVDSFYRVIGIDSPSGNLFHNDLAAVLKQLKRTHTGLDIKRCTEKAETPPDETSQTCFNKPPVEPETAPRTYFGIPGARAASTGRLAGVNNAQSAPQSPWLTWFNEGIPSLSDGLLDGVVTGCGTMVTQQVNARFFKTASKEDKQMVQLCIRGLFYFIFRAMQLSAIQAEVNYPSAFRTAALESVGMLGGYGLFSTVQDVTKQYIPSEPCQKLLLSAYLLSTIAFRAWQQGAQVLFFMAGSYVAQQEVEEIGRRCRII